MPARIYNLPAYSVYDVTPTATITVSEVITGGGDHTLTDNITGTTESTRDLDLTSYWENYPTVNAGSGSNTYTLTLTYDFKRVFWNCIIYVKWANGTSVDYSPDGTNWTQLGNSGATATYGVFNMQYLRFVAQRTDVRPRLTVYEVKMMGS